MSTGNHLVDPEDVEEEAEEVLDNYCDDNLDDMDLDMETVVPPSLSLMNWEQTEAPQVTQSLLSPPRCLKQCHTFL